MTMQEFSSIFRGEIPDELASIANEMKRLVERGFKPTIKSCLTASGSKRYYYVAADTTYMFDPPCAAVSIKVNLNNHVWTIYFRHGNAWIQRDGYWFVSHLANRPLDHLEPLGTADALSRWVWSKCGQGIGFDAEGNEVWRLVNDACYRLFEADKVKDPIEEPKQTKVQQHREPRVARASSASRASRVAKKDVAGPDLQLDF